MGSVTARRRVAVLSVKKSRLMLFTLFEFQHSSSGNPRYEVNGTDVIIVFCLEFL